MLQLTERELTHTGGILVSLFENEHFLLGEEQFSSIFNQIII